MYQVVSVCFDNCVRLLPFTPSRLSSDVTACGGTVVYAYTYTGCDGATQTWTFTYTVTPPTWAVPADGTATVACAAEADAPAVPDVYDNCGRLIPVTLAPKRTYRTACGGAVDYA